MKRLHDIPVVATMTPGEAQQTGNVFPILHQIRHALDVLRTSGESTTIDLSAIPFSPGDREELFRILGKGEVSATLEALGETRFQETAYPGVWLVVHESPQKTELTSSIEVTSVPSLLRTPQQDIRDACDSLDRYLTQTSTEESA